MVPFWKSFTVWVACFLGILFAVPNFMEPQTLNKMPSWFPRERVNLGLDLQGGSHLLLEVDVKTALKDRMLYTLEGVRKALRQDKIGYTDLRQIEDTITFKVRDEADPARVAPILRKMDRELDVQVEGTQVRLTLTADALKERKKHILDQSIEIVRRRIDELGTKEPTIQRQGEDRIVVQLPGLDDPATVKRLLGKTAKMVFHLVHPDASPSDVARGVLPPGTILAESAETKRDNSRRPDVYAIYKQPLLSGENLVNASVGFDEYNRPRVHFQFDTLGGRKFAEITRENVGKQLAIVLDGKVISAPVINGVIPGGSGEIAGSFSVEEANELALLMRAGALVAPLTVIEERTVGPDLGADSISAGKRATIVSVIMVAIFMVVAYALTGIIANIALCFNLILTVAVLSLIGATLTLPGIAGIALTMGMAVDANVLINERIKEELRLGRKLMAAIDAGYKRAIATILDSNITTVIGAAALYFFGSGPIRGFGVTLTIGIAISMFTAISLTRVVLVSWVKWRKPKELSI
ncbi:MAG: protein translocase subunit SecD [Holosporales bacterium]